MEDRIEKRLELQAPISRVWRALTDHQEFGAWFRVALEGPFILGQQARGHITYPGYEHLIMIATVQRMDHERLFSFTWHPCAIDPNTDYSSEPPTLGRIPTNPNPHRHPANGHRVRLRRAPAAPPRRSLPYEFQRLVDPDGEHLPTCRTDRLAPAPAG